MATVIRANLDQWNILVDTSLLDHCTGLYWQTHWIHPF